MMSEQGTDMPTTVKAPYAWTAPGWYSELPSTEPDAEEIWGYCDRFSYSHGERIQLFVHTTAIRYEIEIVRDGASPQTVWKRAGVAGRRQKTNRDPYANGCGWEEPVSISVEGTWSSGFYLVLLSFTDRAGARFEREAFFVVRAAPSHRNTTVLLLTTSTMTAYNDWGGANHYRGLSDDPRHDIAAPRLSTLRPVARGMCKLPAGAPREGNPHEVPRFAPPRYPAKEWARLTGRSRHYASAFWASYERHFVVWAEGCGYSFDYLTQQDLEADPDALSGYQCVVVVGHDEYWSWTMRDRMDDFLDAGGNLARFAGNFKWQIRLEESGTLQICYKSFTADPITDPQKKTIMWDHPAIDRPAAATVGLSGQAGIYTRYGNATPRSSGGFTVYRPDHWAFDQTDLYYGDVLGAVPVAIAGFEVDGVDYTFRKGLPYPTHADGAPEDLVILAMCPAVVGEIDRWNGTEAINGPAQEYMDYMGKIFGDQLPEYLRDLEYGSGMIGVCTRGRGTVFNAGTTDWVMGLAHRDVFVEQITRNVLDRLGGLDL
jgi:hypothetical protein